MRFPWSKSLEVLEAVEAYRDNAPRFSVIGDESIDPAFFGLTSYASTTSPAPRVDRRTAIQVPAVKRTRDLIAGTLGTLPIGLVGPDRRPSYSSLFEQPERNTPRSVTMARTFEDLLFEGTAWWLITEYGWNGFPVKVVKLDPRTVDVKTDGKVYVTRDGHRGMRTEHVEDRDLIRFDSPNEPLLVAGARAIRTCLALESAAQRYADGAPPIDYFTPAEGVDPVDVEDDVEGILDDWQAARQARATGYVPAVLKYNVAGWNPEQLQMAEARQHAVLEIARLAGVDPEELGVSTTSRTYANQFDRRKQFIDFTLGGYRQAIEDRLSMGDVTPRGYTAKFDLSAFLRSDDKTRYETYEIGQRVGAIDGPTEVRELEGKPPLTVQPTKPQQQTASTEEPADV